jgi:hypothetical protein
MSAEKTQHRVVAYTRLHRIEGEIVLLKGEHLSDKLDMREKRFEMLLNAKVFSSDGGTLLHEAPYVAVNKEELSILLPADPETAPES